MPTIFFEGMPIAKQRPRVNRKTGMVYTAPDHLKEINLVKHLMHLHTQANNIAKFALHSTIAVKLTFYLTYPKSLTTSEKNRLSYDRRATSKPDIDNLVKFYLDCANGILWEDDAAVQNIIATKYYSNNPFTRMDYMIRELYSTNKISEVVSGIIGSERLMEFARDVDALAEVDHEDVEAMVETEVSPGKTQFFDRISQVIAKFAMQHGEELHDIQKSILKKNYTHLVV